MSEGESRHKKAPSEPFVFLVGPKNKNEKAESRTEEKPKRPEPQASLRTIGLTDCSVCRAEVSVLLTRSFHPFTACGRCGARTFYNSQLAIDLLKHKMRALKDE